MKRGHVGDRAELVPHSRKAEAGCDSRGAEAVRDSRGAESMLRDLKRAGLKMTAQRIAIVRLFAEDLSHPTAQDLYERLRLKFPSMSFATVYNTLDALANAGLSGTLRLGNAARFDPNTTPHHHAVCDKCGAVQDIHASTLAPKSSALEHVTREAKGFSVRAVERIYRGLCATCNQS